MPAGITPPFDGMVLAFAGLLTGLAIFVPLWILKASGGGDVKVFAATAAVLGPTLAVFLLLITMVVVMVWTVAIMLLKARGAIATSPHAINWVITCKAFIIIFF